MPNSPNRFKLNRLIKDEKENENKDIKRKWNTAAKDKPTTKPPEVAWRRATKTRSFRTDVLPTTSTIVKSSHRLPPPSKTPLSPNLAGKNHVEEIMFETVMSEKQTENWLHPCKTVTSIKEIMTARSICNSKSSSGESRHEWKSTFSSPRSVDSSGTNLNFRESLDDFEVMSPMLTPSRDYSNCSTIIANNFRDLLKRRAKMMNPEEIRVIKDVVKTDGRYRELKNADDELFKDILKTQLQKILKQESTVKSALQKLDSTSAEKNIPEKILVGESLALGDAPASPQVDVIFMNVPTLEREIYILKALGEKLEATLKRTLSERNVISKGFDRPIEVVWSYYLYCSHNAEEVVRPMGVRQVLGFVREFSIVKKTLADLKNEAKCHFYLPTNNEQTELKRTTFKRLKDKPDELMRHLKANNSLVQFNVLDQDPMFFNSFLFNKAYTGDGSSESEEEYIVTMREAGEGDHLLAKTEFTPYCKLKSLKIEEIRYPVHDNDNETDKELTNPSEPVAIEERLKAKPPPIPIEAPIRGRQRRRIRRLVSPLPLDKCIEPKNSLLRTILVGSVQISVFLLLIMAITYPELKC